ncbi:MAG: inositol monophosphatase family protein [Candidatus Izemoplasmatales bacterium]
MKETVVEASKLMSDRSVEVNVKGVKEDLVTSADIDVQRFLNEELSRLIEGSVVLGEENEVKTYAKYTWIVDPIDGTMNFTRGIPHSAISVGLLVDGTIELGVVYSPLSGEMFHALRGQGAYLNDRPIHVSDRSFGDALFCTALSTYDKRLAPICLKIMKDVYARCSDIRRFGSCALELCYLACGRVDLFFEIRVFPWDYAGASIVLSEAGGRIETAFDRSLEASRAVSVAAANTVANDRILRSIIARHMKGGQNVREPKRFVQVKPKQECLKKNVDYDLTGLYENAHDELTLQQSKRDQIIAFYLTLVSLVIPLSYSIEGIGPRMIAWLFFGLFMIGLILGIVIVRYKVYKEVYWACCQTISQLFNYEEGKIKKDLVQSVFYEILKKKDPAKHGRVKGAMKAFFSAETLMYEIHIIMSMACLGFATQLLTGGVALTVFALLLYFVLMQIVYFSSYFRVFNVCRTNRDADFNYAFGKAWFLHFYINYDLDSSEA